MKNLAGVSNADDIILEELYLANIPHVSVKRNTGEVEYSYIGNKGNWEFKRHWSYWSASVKNRENGLPLDLALELHNKKHPILNIKLGDIIRSGGHGCKQSPDEYGAQPVYNDQLEKQLIRIGYKRIYNDFLKHSLVSITVREISKLCNEGKLNVERFVDLYHIDEQIGLNEFAKYIKQ